MQSFKHHLIHLNDSPTVPPTELPALNGPVLPLYEPGGTLAAFIMMDAGFNLNFYRDQTFTNPNVLLSGVVNFAPIQSAPLSELTSVSADASLAYLSLVHPDDSMSLYRVDYTGVRSADIYDSRGELGGGPFDSDYLYFGESIGQAGSIPRVPLNGSAKLTLIFQYTADNPYGIIGISGGQMVLESGGAGNTLSTLPVNGAGSPSQIATLPNKLYVAIRSGDLFVGELGIVGTFPTAGPSYFSDSVTLDGTVLQARMANSSFVCCSSNTLLEITNTDGPTGLSAGSVSAISVAEPSAPTSTPLKDATGVPFAVSSGVVYASSYDVTSTVGYVRAQTDAHYLAYFYDQSKNLVVAVPVDTSDVFVMGVPN